MACIRDLVPQAGIQPGPPALGAWSLTLWTTREVPLCTISSVPEAKTFSTNISGGIACCFCWRCNPGCVASLGRGVPSGCCRSRRNQPGPAPGSHGESGPEAGPARVPRPDPGEGAHSGFPLFLPRDALRQPRELPPLLRDPQEGPEGSATAPVLEADAGSLSGEPWESGPPGGQGRRAHDSPFFGLTQFPWALHPPHPPRGVPAHPLLNGSPSERSAWPWTPVPRPPPPFGAHPSPSV